MGVSRVRAAAKDVPFRVRGAQLVDCRIGLARVLDFAAAGYVSRYGGLALRNLSESCSAR